MIKKYKEPIIIFSLVLLFVTFVFSLGWAQMQEANTSRHQICKDYGAVDYDERMGACYKIKDGHRVRVNHLHDTQYTDLYSRNNIKN